MSDITPSVLTRTRNFELAKAQARKRNAARLAREHRARMAHARAAQAEYRRVYYANKRRQGG